MPAYTPLYDDYFTLEEQIEQLNWEKRSMPDGWDPDAVPPPLGNVYEREAPVPKRSSLWLVAAVALFLTTMFFVNRITIF